MKKKEISLEEYNTVIDHLLTHQTSKELPMFWKNAKLHKVSLGREIYINNKQVFSISNVLNLLTTMWLNPKYGGVGVERFYNHVKRKFWGITKKTIQNFTNNLETYQLHKKIVEQKLLIL